MSTSTLVIGSGWQSGMSSCVRLAAMMPAMRAAPSTSPFLALPLSTMSSVFGLHHDAAFGDRDALGRGLGRDVDHARFAALAEMGELGGSLPRLSRRLARARARARAARGSRRRHRSAASGSRRPGTRGCRPRRGGRDRPACGCRSRRRSRCRRARAAPAARSTASVVSNVLRSRLLMPISRDFSFSARSSSASSCTSTSTSMPNDERRVFELARGRVVERRHDDQDAVGAPGARFRHLIGLEHEILAQRRQRASPRARR